MIYISGSKEPKWKKKVNQITEDGNILWINVGKIKKSDKK
jgi:hypothetical protein